MAPERSAGAAQEVSFPINQIALKQFPKKLKKRYSTFPPPALEGVKFPPPPLGGDVTHVGSCINKAKKKNETQNPAVWWSLDVEIHLMDKKNERKKHQSKEKMNIR